MDRLPPELILRIFDCLTASEASIPSFFALTLTSRYFHNVYTSHNKAIVRDIASQLIPASCVSALLACVHITSLQRSHRLKLSSSSSHNSHRPPSGFSNPHQLRRLLHTSCRAVKHFPTKFTVPEVKEAAALFLHTRRLLAWIRPAESVTGCATCDFLEAMCLRYANVAEAVVIEKWFRGDFSMHGMRKGMHGGKRVDGSNEIGAKFAAIVYAREKREAKADVARGTAIIGYTQVLDVAACAFAVKVLAGEVGQMYRYAVGKEEARKEIRTLLEREEDVRWNELYWWKERKSMTKKELLVMGCDSVDPFCGSVSYHHMLEGTLGTDIDGIRGRFQHLSSRLADL